MISQVRGRLVSRVRRGDRGPLGARTAGEGPAGSARAVSDRNQRPAPRAAGGLALGIGATCSIVRAEEASSRTPRQIWRLDYRSYADQLAR